MFDSLLRPLANYDPQIHSVADYRSNSTASSAGFLRAAACAILLLISIGVCGCANTELTAAQQELADGNYATAHDKFVSASRSPKLSTREWRELADGLCITEAKLGSPQYPLAEQRRICANAAARPGSTSGPTLARIDSAEHDATGADVTAALKSNDIAGAQAAVVRYQAFPGADQLAIAEWSKQIWSALEQQEGSARHHDRHLVPAIAAVSQRYRKVRAMNDTAFKRWVLRNATVSRTPLVNGIDLRKGTIDLRVAGASLPEVALNLDRFAQINDAMVARCHCDGRTNIAVEGSGLPAYLLRLDPETRQSEVLVMPQPH
jgi:hypothetical protein